jgi:hypothetical protein
MSESALPQPDPALERRDRLVGRWSMDSGGWRPNPGADERVNVPNDIGGRRLDV